MDEKDRRGRGSRRNETTGKARRSEVERWIISLRKKFVKLNRVEMSSCFVTGDPEHLVRRFVEERMTQVSR